jgi:hypothetical protein
VEILETVKRVSLTVIGAVFIKKIPPNLPFPKGGTISPLWKRGARGDFMVIAPVTEWVR